MTDIAVEIIEYYGYFQSLEVFLRESLFEQTSKTCSGPRAKHPVTNTTQVFDTSAWFRGFHLWRRRRSELHALVFHPPSRNPARSLTKTEMHKRNTTFTWRYSHSIVAVFYCQNPIQVSNLLGLAKHANHETRLAQVYTVNTRHTRRLEHF